jgi:hypothetical protein
MQESVTHLPAGVGCNASSLEFVRHKNGARHLIDEVVWKIKMWQYQWQVVTRIPY